MRLPGSEKLEIIRLVEQSHLPARRTLEMLGVRPSTFYRWYDRYRAGGPEALEDKPSKPDRVWNRIPDEIRHKVIEWALEQPELSPREVAVAFTDAEKTFVSEASVYRILKAEGLVTSPAFIVMKAADAFANPTTAINQLWQTDFTYLKITGWGGIISRPCSTTSRAISSPGSSAPPCAPTTSPPRSIWRWRRQGSTRSRSRTGRGC